MLPFLISGIIFGSALLLPVRHAFGVLLVGSFLIITPGNYDISSYCFLILFARTVLIKGALLDKKINWNKLLQFFTLLVLFSILSFILFRGIFGLEILISYARIFIAITCFFYIFRSPEDLKILVPYIIVAVGMVMIHIASQFLGMNPFATPWLTKEGRLVPRDFTNNHVNSNTYSAHLVWPIGVILVYFKLFNPSKYLKGKVLANLLLVSLFFISFIVLGFLGSRSNIIILLLVFFVAFFKINLAKSILFSIPLLIAFLFFLNFENLLLESNIPLVGETTNLRLKQMLIESEEENKTSRIFLSKAGMQLFLQNPIFGIGLGNEAKGIKYIMDGGNHVSHNTYINLLSELGLVGLGLILFFLGIWRKFMTSSIFIAFSVLILFYGLVHDIKVMSTAWITICIFFRMMEFQHNSSMEKRQLQSA